MLDEMGTSGGEPKVLLDALRPMLGMLGEIKTPHEIMRIVGLMKDAEKLMSRCVYLNILKATCRQALQDDEKKETLHKFLSAGGWGILNKWLFEFTRTENFPVLHELIDVLRVLPITIELLKQGNTGKLIKQMTKLDNADLKKSAWSLIKQWKDMIRGGPDKKALNGDAFTDADLSEAAGKRLREGIAKEEPAEKRQRVGKGKSSEVIPKYVQEGIGFMNALNAAAPVPLKKKRRNSSGGKPTLPLDEILNKSSGDKKLKLEADNERLSIVSQSGASPVHDLDPDARSPVRIEDQTEEKSVTSDLDFTCDESAKLDNIRKKKRNITWAPDDQICKVHYFELFEGEKAGHHASNFSAARQHELLLEKQLLLSAKRHVADHMIEKVNWYRPVIVDNADIPNFVYGEKSREKYNQTEREKSVLAFIFLTKDSLPDTPSEPDYDPEDHSENRPQPKAIPHDEAGTLFPLPKVAQAIKEQDFLTPPLQVSSASQPIAAGSSPNIQKPVVALPLNVGGGISPAVQSIMSQLMKANQGNGNMENESARSLSQSVPALAAAILGQQPIPLQSSMDIAGNGLAPPIQSQISVLNARPPPPPLMGQSNNGAASFARMRGPTSAGLAGGGQIGNYQMQPPQEWRSSGTAPVASSRGGSTFYRGPRPRFSGISQGPNEGFESFMAGDYTSHDAVGVRGGRGFLRGGVAGRARFPSDRGRPRPERGRIGHGPERGGVHRDRGRGVGPPRGRDVCRHFLSQRGCQRSESCPFLHPVGLAHHGR